MQNTTAKQPTPEELRETLLYLGGDEDDGRFVMKEAIDRLLVLGVLGWRSKNHLDLTDYGESIYDRLVSGGDVAELC